MYTQVSIQQVSTHSGIWMLLFTATASLGLYYSVILLIRDRGRGGQRFFMGMYVICLSVLLLHLLVLRFWDGLAFYGIQITGILALFIMGPFSYRLMIDRPRIRGALANVITYAPGLLMTGFLVSELIHESVAYTLGMVYTGLWLVLQALNLRRLAMYVLHLRWSQWYTLVQIFLFAGIGISCLALNGMLSAFLASAGLAILILLAWIRLLYIAYLSYVISKS